jgi:hypothetical protein
LCHNLWRKEPLAYGVSEWSMVQDIYVIFWFDTEDYVTPEADDAAKRLAEILEEQGVRGVFKIVGEKLRAMEKRGRQDVISALAKHDIGYHSEFHSRHPVISEYLKDLDWEEGVKECEGREGKGVEDIRRIFRVNPSCYGQPGGAWAPQIYGALLKWDIPVYLDETAFIGLDERPFWYCGILNVLNLGRNVISVNFGLGTPGFLQEVCKRFKDICERLKGEGGGVISVFNHPCTLVTEEFWDGVNFSNGKNPSQGLIKPRMKSNDAIEAGYRDFSDFVHYVISFPGVKVITARDALDIYSDKLDGKILSKEEVLKILASTHEGMSFYKGNEITLSPAEIFWLAASCLRGLVTESRMPDAVRARRVLGPTEEFFHSGSSESIRWKDFAESCIQVAGYIEGNGIIPSRVKVGKLTLSPSAYLKMAIGAIGCMTREGRAPSTLAAQNGMLETATYISEEGARDAWKWVIFPEGFAAPGLVNIARLQAWTLKPAYRASQPVGSL